MAELLDCNGLAQFQEDGMWSPVKRVWLTPEGKKIAGDPVAFRPLTPQQVNDEMAKRGDVYIGNRFGLK